MLKRFSLVKGLITALTAKLFPPLFYSLLINPLKIAHEKRGRAALLTYLGISSGNLLYKVSLVERNQVNNENWRTFSESTVTFK